MKQSELLAKLPDLRSNLRFLYAYNAQAETVEGLEWYPKARTIIKEWSHTYGYSTDTIATVIAAISPQVAWSRNLIIADDILAGRSPSIGGAIQSNIRKAQRLLELGNVEGKSVGCRMLEVFPQGPKVYNFALNLSGIDSAVTVDTHAAQAAFHDPTLVITLKWSPYGIIAKCYQEVAAEVGLQASEFQAIIWHTWKRMYPRMDKYFLRRKWA